MNPYVVICFCLLTTIYFFVGCATTAKPKPTHTVDIYIEDSGFFVITERGSDNSIAYRFNTTEIHPTETESK